MRPGHSQDQCDPYADGDVDLSSWELGGGGDQSTQNEAEGDRIRRTAPGVHFHAPISMRVSLL